MKIIKISQTSQNDISDFPIWLHQQIMEDTNNFKKHSRLNEEQIETLTDWAYETKPNFKGLNLSTAYAQARIWRQLQQAQKYTNNKAVFKWKDGWKIVTVPEADIGIERELMTVDDEAFVKMYGTNDTRLESSSGDLKEGWGRVVYSLRDPQNMPRATIEIEFTEEKPELLYVQEIFTNEEMVRENYTDFHARKNYIKDFFDYLKSKGYQFGTVEGGSSEDVKASNLQDHDTEDQFGLPYELWGIGGSEDNYYDGIMESYQAGGDNYWSKGSAFKAFDNLLAYAESRNELNLLEKAFYGYTTKGKNQKGEMVNQYKGFEETVFDWWNENDMNFEHPYPGEEPDEKDFMIQPDPNQPSIPGLPPIVPILDKQAYQEALQLYQQELKLHEEERDEAEKHFEPYIFQNYVHQELEKAKARQKPSKKVKPLKANNMRTIIKTADKIDEKLPNGEQMALYTLTLKEYLKDNKDIPEEWKNLIEKLPAPRQIRQDFSIQELRLLYETLEFLWTRITKQKIISDEEIIKAPESLSGNYIMLNNGILLEGINTYDIIKKNSSLISSLLNIGGITMQEYLSGKPSNLIHLVIKNGGIRIFIAKDKRMYCQMTPDTYSKWGRDKIRKLDFKFKAVKLIDLRASYSGWKDGLTVKL